MKVDKSLLKPVRNCENEDIILFLERENVLSTVVGPSITADSISISWEEVKKNL